jgi:hypothetical protein
MLTGVLASLPAAARAERSIELHLPGISHHFGVPKVEGRSWNELHDGLGVQFTDVSGASHDRVRRLTAGFMRDSFGKQGLYAGASYGLRLADDAVSIDALVSPMLLLRTVNFDSTARKLIPIVLPTVSFQHKASGVGGNLTVLPAGNFGKDLKFPGLIYLQFTYRLR